MIISKTFSCQYCTWYFGHRHCWADKGVREKYTNTQINKYKVLKRPYMCYIFKSMGFKDIKYNIPVCHESHEGHEGHDDISAFICISLNFSCISHALLMRFSAFICIKIDHNTLWYIIIYHNTLWCTIIHYNTF